MLRPNSVIVIPAFNEAEKIALVVRGLSSIAEVIVVDDGSVDATASLCETAGAILVSHLVNQGYDRSILSGLAKAKAMGFHFCVTMDADGQHPKNKLEEFFEKLENGNQLVIGRRQGFQRFGEWVFGLVSQYVWGVPDPLCGMKGYDLRSVNEVMLSSRFDSIGTSVALQLIEAGVRPERVDINTIPRAGSSRFGLGIKADMKILQALIKSLIKKFII